MQLLNIMAPATRSRKTNDVPPQQAQQRGNLATLLTSYDHSQKNQSLAPESLTINVPGANGENDRDRSLTLGSEFDLGFDLGKEGRGMSFSGLLTPGMGEPTHAATDGMSHDTTTTVVSGSTSSTHNSMQPPAVGEAASTGPGGDAVASASLLPSLPEVPTANVQVDNNTRQAIPARGRGDSYSIATQYLNDRIYQQQQQQPRAQQSQMIAHTPPTQMGTSYENSHFGKRMRAGSVSGRLRSASDLEDTGVISHEQKAILKDLIIAGDNAVQGAIEKYEAGDPSALEEMIKSGVLLAKGSSDVDLLGELDLDFLNVHDDGGMVFGNMDDIGAKNTGVDAQMQPAANDGIGDLEFNGHLAHPQAVGSSQTAQHAPMVYHRARGDSVDDINLHRMRANSLALPGALLEGTNPDDVTQTSFGRWMDKEPSPHVTQQMQGGGSLAQLQYAANVVDAHGSRYDHNPFQLSNECDVLMGSKFRGNSAAEMQDKKPKAKKERTKKAPREKKSQSKSKDTKKSTATDKCKSIGLDGENREVQTGLGRPRSMSDPNLSVHHDDHGLLHVNGPAGWVGAYSPNSRQMRIDRFLEKRNRRVWTKNVKYDVRKNFADSRLRVKGRFVKKEDETLMRELMSLT